MTVIAHLALALTCAWSSDLNSESTSVEVSPHGVLHGGLVRDEPSRMIRKESSDLGSVDAPLPEDVDTPTTDDTTGDTPRPVPTPAPPLPATLDDAAGPVAVLEDSTWPASAADPSICKDADHIHAVRDTRGDHNNWAGVTIRMVGMRKKWGEKRKCSNAVLVGAFPNGRLEACAMAVAMNKTCSDSFALHSESYE